LILLVLHVYVSSKSKVGVKGAVFKMSAEVSISEKEHIHTSEKTQIQKQVVVKSLI